MQNEQVNLTILDANFNEGKALELTLAPEDMSSAYTMKLYAQSYDPETKKWSEDEETTAKFNEQIKEYLDIDEVSEDTLASLVDKEVTVYLNNDTVTFWKVEKLLRPDKELIDELFKAKVTGVRDYDTQRRLVLDLYEENEDGGLGEKLEGKYFVTFNFGQYIKAREITLPVEAKRVDQKEKFLNLTGVEWDDWETLVKDNVTLRVEVKQNNVDTTGKVPTFLELKKRKVK